MVSRANCQVDRAILTNEILGWEELLTAILTTGTKNRILKNNRVFLSLTKLLPMSLTVADREAIL